MFTLKVNDEIYLRQIALQDAEAVFQLTDQSREYLREWLPWLDQTTRLEDTKNYIEFSIEGFDNHKSMNNVIVYKDNIVGIAGFNELDWTNKIAYVGYWMGKGYQGHGIMTKVVEALTDYAFSQLKFNRVEIRAAVENKKSRAIPERLGYKLEGCVRQVEWLYDHYVDHAIYGVLENEWKKDKNKI
ncbi:MAG TPA: GNAT family protein [Bacillaceae bacterium]|nr:GNAT family protein [Paenibacillus bovis]HLU22841.1 GNAT family protein [Bacillaceae bacterium]